MRTDVIERALTANNASLLRQLASPTTAEVTDPNPAESENSPALPAFPEIGWRGIFAEYRDAMEGTTEASDVAHFASLWATCAVSLGRRIYMFAGERIFPNTYITFSAERATRKQPQCVDRRTWAC